MADTSPASQAAVPRRVAFSKPGYVLFLLMVAYLLSFFDRQILHP